MSYAQGYRPIINAVALSASDLSAHSFIGKGGLTDPSEGSVDPFDCQSYREIQAYLVVSSLVALGSAQLVMYGYPDWTPMLTRVATVSSPPLSLVGTVALCAGSNYPMFQGATSGILGAPHTLTPILPPFVRFQLLGSGAAFSGTFYLYGKH